MEEKITSATNPRVKQLLQLMEKPKERRKANAFVVEGRKLLLEAPKDQIRELYVTPELLEQADATLRGFLSQKGYTLLSGELFCKISDTVTPQGILGVLSCPQYGEKDFWKSQTPLFLLLEDVQDPGNVGTIFRSAEGAGVDGIFLTRQCADIFQPKVVRATMGAIYRMPFRIVEDMEQTVAELGAQGILVYAAHLKESCDYDVPSYTSGCGFLIGNESRGLKERTQAVAAACVKIPMAGQVESLTAGVAASLLVYEAARQRRCAGKEG